MDEEIMLKMKNEGNKKSQKRKKAEWSESDTDVK